MTKLNAKTINKPLSSFRKVAIIQLLLSLLHLIILISELKNLSSGVTSAGDPFSTAGNMLLLGATASVMKRHLILFILGTIFSVVGLFMKKPWPYLTSAIIDTVSLVFGLTLLLAAPILLVILIPAIVLGYVAYSKAKKEIHP